MYFNLTQTVTEQEIDLKMVRFMLEEKNTLASILDAQ